MIHPPACGYNVDAQIELYHEIKENFTKEGKIDIILVFNKMDLASISEIEYLKKKLYLRDGDYFLTDALKGNNLDTLITHLISRYSDN